MFVPVLLEWWVGILLAVATVGITRNHVKRSRARMPKSEKSRHSNSHHSNNMKKVFLLLVFAFFATVAFASNGIPEREGDKTSQNQPVMPQVHQADGKGPCVYCVSCNGTLVCVYCTCGNCDAAFEALSVALCSLGCCDG